MRVLISLILLAFLQFNAMPTAQGAVELDAPDCSTPYRAVYTWLEWLQPERWEPDSAATCFKGPPGMSRAQVIESATHLKEVFDAKGWWITLDTFPDEADYRDAKSGLPHFVIYPKVQDVYLRKLGDNWIFSTESLAVAERLHNKTFNLGIQSLVDRAPAWMLKPFFGLLVWQYFGLLLWLTISFPLGRLLGRLFGKIGAALMARAGLAWGPQLIERLAEPLRLFGGATVFWLFLPQLHLPIRASLIATVAIDVFLASSVVWGLYRAVDVLAEYLALKAAKTETRMDDQLIPLGRKSLKIGVVILGGVFILQNLNVDVQSLVTGLGIGGLAFALAAKDTLANLFGSVTIFLDKPFQVGDWVLTSGVEGTVESVGFRSTRIRTFANSLITLPNAMVADSVINNMGERTYRRVKMLLNLTYSTSPEQIQAFVEGIRAILKNNTHVRQDYYEVHFYQMSSFSLDILLYAFLVVPDWSEELRQRHILLLEVMKLAQELGVEFAFPTQTLHMESMAPAKALPSTSALNKKGLIEAVHRFGPGGALAYSEGPELTEGYFANQSTKRGGENAGE